MLLFLWFGFSQVTNPGGWVSWVPAWPTQLTGISPQVIVILNGSFEVVFGLLLAIGLYVRWIALLLSLHLLLIAYEIGYNDIGVRDFVLAISTLSLTFSEPDRYTYDARKFRSTIG